MIPAESRLDLPKITPSHSMVSSHNGIAAVLPRLKLVARVHIAALICVAGSMPTASGQSLLTGATGVSLGGWHTCVVTGQGGVKCWGDNRKGQLGDGTTVMRLTPVDVSGLGRGISAVAAGVWHTCALTTSGGVRCWGFNDDGQLGDGSTSGRLTPGPVVGLESGVIAIAAGSDHTCALTNAGAVKCWGKNSFGALGDNSNANRTRPVNVQGLNGGVVEIAAGGAHSCARLSSRQVRCWGDNLVGQLGDGTNTDRLIPVGVSGISDAIELATGFAHTCAVRSTDVPMCWGDNSSGQLGDATTTSRSKPVYVVRVFGVQGIAAGGLHTCSRDTNLATGGGDVYCWGENSSDQLGGATSSTSIPSSVSALLSVGVTAIAAGMKHNCVLTTGFNVPSGLKCWGDNSYGQLGDNSRTNRRTPVDVLSGNAVTHGLCGSAHLAPTQISPGSGLCASGIPSSVVGVGPWSWTCNGSGGGTNASCIAPLAGPLSYTGLWYNFPAESESGWGINFTHQGSMVFATLFTYDASGAPLWLVMPAGSLATGTTYTGTLYRTRGPAFNAVPFNWNPATDLSTVGSMTVTFTASDRANLSYTYNGVAVSKAITKQVYGSRAASCTLISGSRAHLENYQDLWYAFPAESEPGWGLNISHQDNTLFATLFTYDATGRDVWLVMSSGQRQADDSYVGTLYRTSGPPFNANPFTPIGANNISSVGTMRISFSSGERGMLSYTFNGVAVTKAITRQVFASSVSSCF